MKQNYAYMVEFDWSVEDGCDVETELFSTYEKALKRYDEIIANEKINGMSWVADAINPNGTIVKGYTFEEFGDRTKQEDLSWHFTMDEYYMCHSIIHLRKLEIK